MATKVTLTGTQTVMRNLNREIKKLKRTSMAGLIEAAVVIVHDMDKTSPLIPVDQGNLRASRYVVSGLGKNEEPSPAFKGEDKGDLNSQHISVTQKAKGKAVGKSLVIFGFSANYAAAVEENNDPKEWNRPGSGRAFMQSSIKRNQGKVVKIIARRAKIK